MHALSRLYSDNPRGALTVDALIWCERAAALGYAPALTDLPVLQTQARAQVGVHNLAPASYVRRRPALFQWLCIRSK